MFIVHGKMQPHPRLLYSRYWSTMKGSRLTMTYATDTRDRDQNLIRPILGLDRLILAGTLS